MKNPKKRSAVIPERMSLKLARNLLGRMLEDANNLAQYLENACLDDWAKDLDMAANHLEDVKISLDTLDGR